MKTGKVRKLQASVTVAKEALAGSSYFVESATLAKLKGELAHALIRAIEDEELIVKLEPPRAFDRAKINAVEYERQIRAQELVRCKDCTEFSDDDEEDGWGFCNNTGVGMERDGFCSYGERKDDE